MRALVLLLMSAIATVGAYAQQERRLALVLANEDYPAEIGRLTNTHEDAAKVESALRDIGFSVTKVLDANAGDLDAAITDFEIAVDREAADGDKVVAFVYASMHGASADVNGRTRNFLLPAREQIASSGQLFRKGVRIDQLISGLGATEAEAVFVVSDACRNSIATSFSKSTNKGFVPINAGPGILVAYATAPGTTTPDDGLFADVLARELRVSGRKASFAMFSAVEAISRARPYEGQPFISPGGLPDWLCFNGCAEDESAANNRESARAQAIANYSEPGPPAYAVAVPLGGAACSANKFSESNAEIYLKAKSQLEMDGNLESASSTLQDLKGRRLNCHEISATNRLEAALAVELLEYNRAAQALENAIRTGALSVEETSKTYYQLYQIHSIVDRNEAAIAYLDVWLDLPNSKPTRTAIWNFAVLNYLTGRNSTALQFARQVAEMDGEPAEEMVINLIASLEQIVPENYPNE